MQIRTGKREEGLATEAVSHAEVLEVGKEKGELVKQLVKRVVGMLPPTTVA